MEQNEWSDGKIFGVIFGSIIGGIILLTLIFGSFGVVQTGEIGVKTRLGRLVGTVDTGLYFKTPFIEKVQKLETRTRVIKNEHYVNEQGEVISDNALESASSDSQNVRVSVVVNYSIDQTKAIEIFTKYKTIDRYEEGVIKPIIKDIVKVSSAKFSAPELITKRADFNTLASESIRTAISEKGAVFEQANITNIEFSPAYTNAIEKKVTAEQEALAAKNNLDKSRFEAEAIRITSEAANNEKYIQLQELEVQKEAVKKWNGVLPVQMIPGQSVPFINVK